MEFAAFSGLMSLVIGLQTFWVSRSIDRLATEVGGLRSEMRGDFAHVREDIADLRERITRLED